MLEFLKKKRIPGDKAVVSVEGMHCGGCAVKIDFALEDLKGVFKSKTNFASSKVEVEFDPKTTSLDMIKKIIKKQGYTISQ